MASSHQESKLKVDKSGADENATGAAAVEKAGSSAAAAAGAKGAAVVARRTEEKKNKKEKEKKYKWVKIPKADLDYILSFKSRPLTPIKIIHTDDKDILDCFPLPLDQMTEYFAKMDAAFFEDAEDGFLEMQARVREEYNKNGYAHYWVTDDEDEAPRAPRAPPPGRRRARPGLVKHKGGGNRKLH